MNYSTKYLSITLFFMVSTIVCSSDFEYEFLQDALHQIKKDGLVLKNDAIKARKEAKLVMVPLGGNSYEPMLVYPPKNNDGLYQPKKIIRRGDAIEDAIAEQRKAFQEYKLTESEKNAKCRSRIKEDFDAVFPYIAFIGIIKYWTK